jgi:DNA-binding NarL/FixJ family response regulator
MARSYLKAALSLQPDVVLADIGMPSLNGLDAGRRLKQANPHVKLIYLTMNNNVEYAREALHAGASAFVLKNALCLPRTPSVSIRILVAH